MNLFIVFLISIQIKIQIETSMICKNPDKQYLDALFSDYLRLFRKYEEKIFENKIQLSQNKKSDEIDLEESI